MAAGYRTLPEEIKREIDSLDGAPFVFGAINRYSEAERRATVARLQLSDASDGAAQGIPPATVGRWSRWNLEGWTKVWRDRPKTQQSFTHEVPNYRGNGYHDVSWTRDVWDKSRWFGEQVEAQLTLHDDVPDVSIGIVQKAIQGPFESHREHEFRYLASLSREWFGQARLFRVGDEGIPDIPNDSLGWDPLPPGSIDQIREYVTSRYGSTLPAREIEIMIDRFESVESLRPEQRLIGSSGLHRYIGYKFGPDFVAFENARIGNALYVLRGGLGVTESTLSDGALD